MKRVVLKVFLLMLWGLVLTGFGFGSMAVAGDVLLDEDFSDVVNGNLPEGWSQATGQTGAAYVKEGSLFIDGTASNYAGTAVDLPDSLYQYGNYKIDAVFTITACNFSSRWVGFKYRLSENGEPYHQMCVRQNATATNGTELAYRNAGWTILDTEPFTEAISAGKTYNVTIIVYGDRVRQYLNGVLQHDGELYEDSVTGGIGLQAAGAVLRLDSITVTEQTQVLPSLERIYTVNEPETDLSMVPTFVRPLNNLEEMDSMEASSAMFFVDASLDLTNAAGEKLGSAGDILEQEDLSALPVFYVNNTQTVDALAELASEKNTIDFTVVSPDPEIVKYARTLMPLTRGAVDFTSNISSNNSDTLLKIIGQTNRSGSKIAILPANIVTRDNVNYLQRMMITVWASVDPLTQEPSESVSETRAAKLINSGVNGIVTRPLNSYTDILGLLKPETRLRRAIVVGHRGVPSLYPENTLEGAVHAYELGAQAVECDIYLTTDDHIVIMHDSTVDRTTDGTGAIESMTLQEVKALTIDDDTYTGLKVPTMAEFFAEFKGKPVTHFIEIKSGNTAIVQKLKELIDSYDVADQVVVISFSDNQLNEMAEVMPDISVGRLYSFTANAKVDKTLRSILEVTQPLSSVFSPSYSSLTPELLEAAKHRGMTFWCWTYRSQFDFEDDYTKGMHGMTTDYAQWAGQFPVQIETPKRPITTVSGSIVEATADILLQNRTTVSAHQFEMVVLNSTAPYTCVDGELVFSGPGFANIMLGYKHELDFDNYYYIYSDPVKVIVKRKAKTKN